jgi:DnaK suppressor protein
MKNKTYQKQGGEQEEKTNEANNNVGSTAYERYSDEELKEFRALIVAKLEEATADYEMLKGTLRLTDDHGTDDTSPTFKLLEDAADVSSKEETAQLASRQEKFIQHLQNALIRVENKSYGVCRVTGKLIPKERLRSVPHATMSVDAKKSNPS